MEYQDHCLFFLLVIVQIEYINNLKSINLLKELL